MSHDCTALGSKFTLPDYLAERLTEISKELRLTAGEIIEVMVAQLVEVDDCLQRNPMLGIPSFMGGPEENNYLELKALSALPVYLRAASKNLKST